MVPTSTHINTWLQISNRVWQRCSWILLLIAIGLPTGETTARNSDSGASNSDDVYIVVGRIDGIRRSRRHRTQFQRALGALPNVQITSSRIFSEQALGLRIRDALPEDATGLEKICELLELDGAIYVQVEPDGRDSRVTVTLYAGDQGQFMGEQVIRVPNGRLNEEVWRVAAAALLPELQRLRHTEAISKTQRPRDRVVPRAAVRVRERRPESRRPRTATDRARRSNSERGYALDQIDSLPVDSAVNEKHADKRKTVLPIAQLRVGAMALARTFSYTTNPASLIFAEGGIDYELGLVPGFVIDAHVAPFAHKRGAIRGLGFRLLYEKAFFQTLQTVTKDDGSETTTLLESRHSHIAGQLTYRHVFGSRAEIGGYLGGGNLTFELAENAEYGGASYGYIELGMQGFVPLGTPYFGLDARAGILPYASLGDTVEELGDSATIFGYRVYVGLEARLPMGLTFSSGAEYTVFQSDVSGEGRGGRIGQSASDDFITLRFLGGYRF
jgi:hypothetical protein